MQFYVSEMQFHPKFDFFFKTKSPALAGLFVSIFWYYLVIKMRWFNTVLPFTMFTKYTPVARPFKSITSE